MNDDPAGAVLYLMIRRGLISPKAYLKTSKLRAVARTQ